MAKHYSSEQWSTWFSEYERGELSIGEFCRSIGASVNTFYKWRKRLAADAEAETTFVPLVLTGDDEIRFKFAGGVTAVVPNDAATLRPLVQLLLEQGASQ